MKKYLTAGAGAAFAGAAMLLSLAGPAQAQTPGGSYLQTCRDVRVMGDSISAVCRRVDGSWDRSALRDVDSCRGGIANMNGQLTCTRGGREFSRDNDRPRWRDRDVERFGGYGSSYDEGYRPRHRDWRGDRGWDGDRDWYGR